MHYHIFMGTASGAPMATSTFDTYSESVDNFLRLGERVYGHTGAWSDQEAIDKMSESEEGVPVTFGAWPLCIQWVICEGVCFTPSWN